MCKRASEFESFAKEYPVTSVMHLLSAENVVVLQSSVAHVDHRYCSCPRLVVHQHIVCSAGINLLHC